nr:uncharacterized protein LOC109763907 [Aegilops tauschii subsp. strangulata]
MDGYGSSGDEAERPRRARSDAARKRGARRWLNRGSRRRSSRHTPSSSSPLRRGVFGPEDYLPPRQEELLERVVLEQSAREQEELEERHRRELEYEQLFLQTGVAALQAHASKEADLRLMKAEQAKFYIDLDSSDSD